MMLIIVVFVIVLSGFSSQSYAAHPLCNELDAAVDDYLKQAAKTDIEGFGDNSAPRATTRLLQVNNYLQLANMNLSLLIQNKCAVRSTSINPSSYLLDAVKCSTAEMQNSEDKASVCDRRTWKGGVPK